MQACRNAIYEEVWDRNLNWNDQSAAHAGLVLARCLAEQREPNDRSESAANARRQLQQAAIAASGRAVELYRQAYERWKNSCPADTQTAFARVRGRMVVGLGSENVLETGITLHHTYGVPIIPGSALKGLAAHYCHRVLGACEARYRIGGEVHKLLFGTAPRPGSGTTEKAKSPKQAGHIVFHDAWLCPDCLVPEKEGLIMDVMTPHHGEYYAGRQETPTDFDDPNPVTFLSVAGTFLVAVSCDAPGPEGKAWAELAMKLLLEALADWGVGGKTSSGYGRMEPSDTENAHPPGIGESHPKEKKVAKPRYQSGQQITVTRIEDSKKGKKQFRADDGFKGHIAAGEEPDIEIGQTTELWVANVGPQGYTFSMNPPKKKGKQQPSRRK